MSTFLLSHVEAMDSTNYDANKVIEMYLELARTLKKKFPNAKLVFNKLVRRTWTKYTSQEVVFIL